MRKFAELLRHLNQELAPAVCVLSLVSSSWALSGTAWLLGWSGDDQSARQSLSLGLSALPVILWTLLAIVPFIQVTAKK